MARPLCRFGVVADVQYADKENGHNFARTVTRYFRPALAALRNSVARWKKQGEEGCGPSFVLNVGDLIDGSTRDLETHGAALQEALSAFAELPSECTVHHMVGNHELMCFSPGELIGKGFGQGGKLFYDFSPAPGWRIVVVHSMEHSVVRPGCTKFTEPLPAAEDPGYVAARELLMKWNPNLAGGEATWYAGVDWTKGLGGIAQKYLPYNGAAGAEQRKWLADTLAAAKAAGERVLVASHIPIHPRVVVQTDILWDQDEVLGIVEKSGVVVAYLAGHCHTGGYVVDNGVAHIVFRAPLEADPEKYSECAATVDILPDRVVVEGHGWQDSYEIPVK